VQQVCVALNYYAGGQYQRVSAICGGISQSTTNRITHKVSQALVNRQAEHIRMPAENQMRGTAQRMEEKFHLPRFAYGVDGMQVIFEGQPRGIPDDADMVPQDFYNRKYDYSINCQVAAHCAIFHVVYFKFCSVFSSQISLVHQTLCSMFASLMQFF